MYTCFLCISNVIYVIAVDSVCAINLPGNVISSRIGCPFLFSLKQRRVSVTTRLSKILSASSILEVLKIRFFLIFFFAFSTHRCIFPYVSGPTAANCCKSDGECNKKTTTNSPFPSLPSVEYVFHSPRWKSEPEWGKTKASLCEVYIFPLIVFFFLVISHCSFFTSWNQDLLTHLKDINCGMSSDPRRSTSLPYQRTIYGFVPNPILPFLPGISRHNWHDRHDTVSRLEGAQFWKKLYKCIAVGYKVLSFYLKINFAY